jgi:anaerobic magnesium-protoporphyrin IX monomethyl ester cyclase
MRVFDPNRQTAVDDGEASGKGRMIDCLIVGFNDVDFESYVKIVRAMGVDGGAYRDLNLAFITCSGKPYRSMDLLNLYRRQSSPTQRPFSNVDFLWPVVIYLYTYLTRRGFTVTYVNLFQDEKDSLIESLRSGSVRTVVITTTLYVWMAPILEIVELVRQHSPATKIIVGGPYVQNQARALERGMLHQLLRSIGADIYIVSSEGESTLARVLGALCAGSRLETIENLVFRDGSAMVQTPESPEANDLAENMVDYSLFPARDYNGFASLRTAKSCPFACAFCAFPQRAGGYSYLPVALVEKELDSIHRLGRVATLSFIDDTFNVPKQRFKDIMRLMIRKAYGFRWNSYLRADHVDDECIELMRQSGCEGVFLGVESGSNRMLTAMNKTARREDYLRVIPQLKSAGILSHANLIIGFPGETVESVRETMDLIESAKPDFYRAQLWYCDPTTPVWEQRERLQIKGRRFNWSHPSMHSETAADWVDRLFLEIEGSTWLPQYGFETWSLYYLQRRGMPLAQVKQFVRAFNAAVRRKVVDPSREEAGREALDAIREACGFDETAPDRSVRA